MIIKLKRYLWDKIVKEMRKSIFYNFIYGSYWHFLFHKSKNGKTENYFFAAIPNPGAGIGHQIANWISGYWFAGQFGLNFAHASFSNPDWEKFLGFGENEVSLELLVKNSGYKKVMLPLFKEQNANEVSLIKNIIKSYNNKKVVFVAEQDQSYDDQFGVMNEIKNKFYNSSGRKDDNLTYQKTYFNIAIHIRRGDIITTGSNTDNPKLLIRWQNNNYFEKVLEGTLNNVATKKPIAIYIFSQGQHSDFEYFAKFSNINFCLDMNARDSFLHMVYADLLITSKSSFSYKPALLSNGIKLCPRNFWHSYPDQKDWVLVEDDGSFNLKALNLLTNE